MDPATLVSWCRRRAGLTQRELASRAGTSAAAVCLYEQGARVPRVDTLARLVAAAGGTLELLEAPAPDIDVDANATALADLLDLADHLPQRRAGPLRVPVFSSVARRP